MKNSPPSSSGSLSPSLSLTEPRLRKKQGNLGRSSVIVSSSNVSMSSSVDDLNVLKNTKTKHSLRKSMTLSTNDSFILPKSFVACSPSKLKKNEKCFYCRTLFRTLKNFFSNGMQNCQKCGQAACSKCS